MLVLASDITLIGEFSDNIKFRCCIIIEHEGDYFLILLFNVCKIDKGADVRRMLMSGSTNWKWPQWCDKSCYVWNKIKDTPANVSGFSQIKKHYIK